MNVTSKMPDMLSTPPPEGKIPDDLWATKCNGVHREVVLQQMRDSTWLDLVRRAASIVPG